MNFHIPNDLKERAIELSEIGVNSIAWKRDDALELLDWLKSQAALVLGGDVLVKDGKNYRYNYDNWHYDEKDAAASAEIARNYILEYPSGDYIFSIIARL